MSIKECSRFNDRGREEKEAGKAEGKVSCSVGPVTRLAEPWGVQTLEWPFRVVTSWAELPKPLYSHRAVIG